MRLSMLLICLAAWFAVFALATHGAAHVILTTLFVLCAAAAALIRWEISESRDR